MTWDAPCPFGQKIHAAGGSSQLGKLGQQEDSSLSSLLQLFFPGPFYQEHVNRKNMNLSSPASHLPIYMLFIKSKNKKNAIWRKLLKISISLKKRREKGHVLSSGCHAEYLLFDT